MILLVREMISERVRSSHREAVAAGHSGIAMQSVVIMIKTTDLLNEVLRDTKHPFKAVSDRPRKPQKHRYERRKARECLRLVEWQSEPA